MGTVVVLGAGATRGASFVNPEKNPCLPPLQSDFYAQLQRIKNKKHQDIITRVIKSTSDLFGTNFRVTFESMFSTLEHVIRMLETRGETGDFKKDDLKVQRNNLVQAIAAVLEESMLSPKKKGDGKIQDCIYHAKLIKCLGENDSIVSFNYDCLIDEELRKHGNGKWNARYGYRLPVRTHGPLVGWDAWNPSEPSDRRKSINLFKLHGSLHFNFEKSRLKLKERPYTRQNGDLHFTIIPPEFLKQFNQGPFDSIWRKAGKEISKATSMILIGYSFPPADLHSMALFRISIKKKSLERLVIVNPDRDARYRTREVLRRGIKNGTRVLVFDTFEEFHAVDQELWMGKKQPPKMASVTVKE